MFWQILYAFLFGNSEVFVANGDETDGNYWAG